MAVAFSLAVAGVAFLVPMGDADTSLAERRRRE